MEMIIASPTPKKTHNVSWSPAMTEFLLEYLTEQTKLGKKGPTGFKVAILIQASEAINEKFEKNLVFCNLQYHLKSLKKKWIIIQDLKKLDGVSFNPETRELRMIPEMYQKYVEANPSHTQFINKPIANYEKMEIVFGNNESGANEKLNDDNNTDPKNENEDFEDSQIATPGEESRKRKKPEPNEEGESAKSESNKKAGHIKWSPIMTEFLLNYLAEEVKMGHKGLSSFKGNALSNAAQAVNHKFGKKMTTYHVQNHLKTLKRRWKTIQKLKGMNGVSFNQENNTLEMDFEEYKVYVEKNPLEEQFINKPIKMYAEMEIVCGYENAEENNNNNNININNKKSIEGASEVSSPDVNIDAADLGLNVDEMEEIPLLPPANNNNNNNNVEEGKIKKDPDELDTPSINMEIEKTSESSSSKQPRNISWSPELSEFVLKFLAEQTRMGNKGSNGFKISVINSAAAAINEKFGKKMNFSNVQNHLKTLKRRWRAIQSVKNMNGVVFHQESKVLEMGHEMYQKHLQENPGHEQFINTPIELYDEMEIVCSNSNYDNKAVTCTPIDLCIIETPENEDKEQIDEQTMPLMAIHYNENNLLEPNNAPNNNTNDTICIINTDNSNNLLLSTEVINDDNNNNNNNNNNVDNNVETNMDTNNDISNNDVGANNENNNVIVNNIGENNDNNNNDNRLGEAKMENISSIIGQMAEALKELSTEKLINFAREIMNELRTIEGEFESKTIRLVQRYLVEHTLDGACFLTYNKDEKVAWVKDFVKDHLDGNQS